MSLARKSCGALWFCGLLSACVSSLVASPIAVPNASFESPVTPFVNIVIESWEKAPKPPEYIEAGGYEWAQLIGAFKNTPPGSSDHLDNCDGDQALYLFAVPKVAAYQDFATRDSMDPAPTHDFNNRFDVGRFYSLAVGVNGGGGGMLEGVSMELGLYYRDDSGNMVTVGSATVVNNLTNFPNHTHLTDFRVHVPVVKNTDPWAGKNIGIRFLSNATDANQGGYWDLDNVRLDSGPDPLACAPAGSNARIAWPTLQGYRYQLQVSPNLQSWTNSGAAQDGTGGELFQLFPVAGNSPSYFRALVAPLAPSPAARPAIKAARPTKAIKQRHRRK